MLSGSQTPELIEQLGITNESFRKPISKSPTNEELAENLVLNVNQEVFSSVQANIVIDSDKITASNIETTEVSFERMVKENTEEAKSLYRQLKNGKSIIDFTPAEQEVLNDPDILTKEIRAEVDSETILPPLVSISPFAGIETGENAIEIEQQPLVKTGEVSIMTDALDGYAKYSGLSPEMKTYIVNNLTAEDLQALYSGLSPRSPQFVDLNSKIQNIINGSVGTVNSTSLTPATNLIDFTCLYSSKRY